MRVMWRGKTHSRDTRLVDRERVHGRVRVCVFSAFEMSVISYPSNFLGGAQALVDKQIWFTNTQLRHVIISMAMVDCELKHDVVLCLATWGDLMAWVQQQ